MVEQRFHYANGKMTYSAQQVTTKLYPKEATALVSFGTEKVCSYKEAVTISTSRGTSSEDIGPYSKGNNQGLTERRIHSQLT